MVVFIDYTAAFDSVSHFFLDEALGEAGASDKSRSVFRSIYENASASVRVRNADGTDTLSSSFPVRRGVVQGDIFSPLCFIVALDCIFLRHDKEEGIAMTAPTDSEHRQIIQRARWFHVPSD